MANSKSSDTLIIYVVLGLLIGIAIIYGVILVVTLAYYILPFLAVLLIVIFSIHWKKIKADKLDGEKILWMTEEEKAKLDRSHLLITKALNQINEANREANSSGIDRNIDGRISARSRKGKELIRIIEENERIYDYNIDDMKKLNELPVRNWSYYRRVFAIRSAAVIGLAIYLISIVFMAITDIELLKETFQSKLELKEIPGNWDIIAIVVFLTLLVFYITMLINYQIFGNKFPKPSSVYRL